MTEPCPRWSRSAALTVVHTVSATTSLPFEHVERAPAGLRATLRWKPLDLGAAPDWSTLEVSGPVTTLDGMGRPWFEYRASVHSRAAFAPTAAHSPPPPSPAARPWPLSGHRKGNTGVVDSPEPSLANAAGPADMASLRWSVGSR